jgi:hypothetical protein
LLFYPKNGVAKCTKENKGKKMEFSKSIFSFCDYVVVLYVAHGYHSCYFKGIAGC